MVKDIFENKLPKYLKNKYMVTTIVFVIWIAFFDPVNFVYQAKAKRTLNKMKDDIEYYTEKIKSDSIKLNELLSNDENLEKFAREEYLMKKEKEEVFIVVEE